MIDGYHGFEPVGEGGWARVYRALDGDGAPVAVKVMRPELGRDAAAVRRFEREGRLMRGLSHPSIPRVLSVTRTREGRPALVMELVRGRDLRAVIAAGPAPWPDVVAVGVGVARALDHAHERGVIHRDIKPSNVMLVDGAAAPEGVRVLDFGVAFNVGETRITRKTSLGTDAYMAPEQRARAAILASDVYSLGVTLRHMLAGRLSDVTPTDAGAPTGLDRLLGAMTSPDPLLRPASAREVERRLLALGDGAAAPTPADALRGILEQVRARRFEMLAQRMELERLTEESLLGALSGDEVALLRSLEEADAGRELAARDLERRAAALGAALDAMTPRSTR